MSVDQIEAVSDDESVKEMVQDLATRVAELEAENEHLSDQVETLKDDVQEEREQREALEETVQQFERFTGPAFAKLVNEIAQEDEVPSYNEVDIIPMAGKAGEVVNERGDRLGSIEDDVRRHESEIQESRSLSADSQAEHWQRVVEKANNVSGMSKHTLPDNWVILYKEDIAAAIEPGEGRAKQLINEWTDTDDEKYKQGTEKQPYRRPSQSRNGKAQKKALKIDLDVWGEDDE